MSGENNKFTAANQQFTKKISDTNSELFGYLGNQTTQRQQYHQYGAAETKTTGRPRAYGGDALPLEFEASPIKTKLKTKYYGGAGNDQWGFGNEDWFNNQPVRPQFSNIHSHVSVKGPRALAKPSAKPNMDKFRKAMLETHNSFRVKHGVGPLSLSDALNQQAQQWAESLAERFCMEHNDEHDYGENIYTCNSSNPNNYPSAQDVCASWYSEIKDFVFGQEPGGSAIVDHFTQLVWKQSTQLGVGMAKGENGAVYVVCNYNPRGNMQGDYAMNVFAPGTRFIPTSAPVPAPQRTPQPRSFSFEPFDPRGSNVPHGAPSHFGRTSDDDSRIYNFRQQMLNAHNIHRAKHGVRFLELSDHLNKYAQQWAQQLARNDELEHRDSNEYGENMYTCNLGDPSNYPRAEEICQDFYDEINDYKFEKSDPDNLQYVGNFTQLVWSGTTELGIGVALASSGTYYIVCNYNPRGNVSGGFSKNVLRPLTQAAQKFVIPTPPPLPPPPPSVTFIKTPAALQKNLLSQSDNRLEQFRKEVLDEHNACRAQHGAPPMLLSAKVNASAQQWAEHLAKQDYLEHNSDTSYGENISSYLSPAPNYYPSAKEVCKDFYEEIKDHKFGVDPDGSAHVEHFTQMVWCATTELGVGVAKAKSGFYYIVVNYNPRGNYAYEFKDNVFPKGTKFEGTKPTFVEQQLQNDIPPPSAVIKPPFVEQPLQIDIKPPSAVVDTRFLKFKKLALNQHNIYRIKHGVPFLTISKELNSSAQNWAERLVEEGEDAEHDESFAYGESVYNFNAYDDNEYPSAEEVCRDFYNKGQQYKYTVDPGVNEAGEFTQMIWKSTSELGIGLAKSEETGTYWIVFHYNPRGNFEGGYKTNVFRPGTVVVPPPVIQTELPPASEILPEEPQTESQLEIFRAMVLSIHNMYRMRHGGLPLKRTEELEIYAQESAEILADEDHCHHRPNCKYGENCSRYASDDPEYFPNPETVCKDYYIEIELYRWAGTPDISENVFHFTQLVWCDSVQIGVGLAKSRTNKYYIVINYNPRGNNPGQFEDNVYPFGTTKRPPKKNQFVPPPVLQATQPPNGVLDINKFRKIMTNQHNIYRKQHGAKFVKISDALNHQAQEWAEKCAKNDKIQLSNGKIGENIYAELRTDPKWYPNAEDVCKHFYNGYKHYTFGAHPDPGSEQFTQLIWNSVAEIGVGVAKAANGRVYVVVNYSPKGNIAGKYGENVLRVVGVEHDFKIMNIVA